MKKTWKIVGIVFGGLALIGLMIGGYIMGKYNKMVNLEENAKQKWSQVENQYQRRADLVPNLVNTVKGYADHEQKTFQKVIEKRAQATQTNVNIQNAKQMAKFQKMQGELSSALSRLMAVSENYPDLKASKNFSELQAQLEGTENRISTERRRYNQVVTKYNKYIRKFPNQVLASMFGFERIELFQAEGGSQNAPEVNFEN